MRSRFSSGALRREKGIGVGNLKVRRYTILTGDAGPILTTLRSRTMDVRYRVF